MHSSIQPINLLCIAPFIFFILSFIHSTIRFFIHSSVHYFIHFFHLFIHSFDHSINLLVHLLVHSLLCFFIHPFFIHLVIHSFIYLSMHSFSEPRWSLHSLWSNWWHHQYFWSHNSQTTTYPRRSVQLVNNITLKCYFILIIVDGYFCIISGHAMPIRSLTFSPDSQLLITASDDGHIKMYDVYPCFSHLFLSLVSHSFIYIFIYSSIHSFFYLFIHSFIYTFIYSFIHPSINFHPFILIFI